MLIAIVNYTMKKRNKEYILKENTMDKPNINPVPSILSVWDTQVGGSHYKDFAIQPTEYCIKNNLGFAEGCVVKYVTRHRFKNGKEDIEKAIHYLEMILEEGYSI